MRIFSAKLRPHRRRVSQPHEWRIQLVRLLFGSDGPHRPRAARLPQLQRQRVAGMEAGHLGWCHRQRDQPLQSYRSGHSAAERESDQEVPDSAKLCGTNA